ncbi:hypothetical protein LCGC14_3091410, partial [marine sediment metagenome]
IIIVLEDMYRKGDLFFIRNKVKR